MSSTALMWAATVAPVADVQEYAILVRMADEADEAGCGVFLATSTIADDVKVSERTAQRRLDAMLDRKLIGLGEQRLAAHIRADHRPVVYDLLIPAACFADLAKTNARRAAKGLAPLTPENRPIQAPPTAEDRRAQRSDVGKPRARKLVDNPDGGRDAGQQDDEGGATDSHPATGGLLVPDGASTSHPTLVLTLVLTRVLPPLPPPAPRRRPPGTGPRRGGVIPSTRKPGRCSTTPPPPRPRYATA